MKLMVQDWSLLLLDLGSWPTPAVEAILRSKNKLNGNSGGSKVQISGIASQVHVFTPHRFDHASKGLNRVRSVKTAKT